MARIILMNREGKGRGVDWSDPLPDEIPPDRVPPDVQAVLGQERFVKTERVVDDGARVYEGHADSE